MVYRFIQIVLSLILAGPATQAWGWSIGIGGVFSVGGDGVKVGSGAHGTYIPTPNCGGTICNTIDKAKNDITGESDRKKQQQEYDAAAADLGRVQGELNKVSQEIDVLNKDSQTERDKFKAYKASQLENTLKFNQHYETYRREFDFMEKQIAEAQKSLQQIRQQSKTIIETAAKTANQLKTINDALGDLPADEQVLASAVVYDVVKIKGGNGDAVTSALSSLQKIVIELNSTFKKIYAALINISSASYSASYVTALDQISESLKQIAKSGEEILASAATSKDQNDQFAATLGAAQE